MPKIAKQNRAIMLAVTTALATTTLAGCASSQAAPRADFSAQKAQNALVKGKTSQAIAHAEESVLAEPRNAGYRAMLGAVYMESGRFQSAATSFKDAMTLGDNSSRTALSYALAEIAAGNNSAALATLSEYRDSIDPADLGLAFSLAGNPERGIHILGNALRAGQATPKVRQNLAYSYALKGEWRAARLMAAEDVPADQVSDRIGEWAQTVRPEYFQSRVANLLGVPLVGDTGQPAQLALSDAVTAEQLAAAQTSGLDPVQVADAPMASPDYALPPMGGELPAVGAQVAVAPAPAPIVGAAPSPAEESTGFVAAFAEPTPTGATLADITSSAVRFVSNPVVQKTPASTAAKAAAESRPVAHGEHLIQLGSFSTEASAKRAWGIYAKRYPQLKDYDMVITEARVRGKKYFRVSAGGFKNASARSMCSTVKAKGQGCITWAANAPLPGAIDRGVRMASR
ncbi:SPOR domain-containing protein [Pontixanthobacter aestiaquae]|uniref:SPOR domain-containing protein n=1 Tax=Pontixanthobacter aestiaquae TaxID=1509367 RepID=A0A844Z4L0_9SPHN|nr:SPOR domain-containing protein [Pontixanthobacter aestiaquae]MDN3646153.1 SPOR domain-containing protein [Pontixanthobacter aestiaquae]MXO82855.1 SPOR domain-containing protein [Pontixanthobacter aestiaquae]